MLQSRLSQHDRGEVAAFRTAVNPFLCQVLQASGFPLEFIEANGCGLRTAEGAQFLDFIAGYGAATLGHRHPALIDALQRAANGTTPFTSPLAVPQGSGRLAHTLCEVAGRGLSKVYFGTSGSEGVECAIKAAVAATRRERCLAVRGAFHGLTIGALALAGGGNWREPIGSFAAFADHVAFGDMDELGTALKSGRYAALFIEPIQASSRGETWSNSQMVKVARMCRETGTLLVIDEVLTGIGRTGKWFAFQWWDESVEPDVVIVSKGLSGGIVPVSAVLLRDSVFGSLFGTGRECIHDSTFSNHLLAVLTASAVLEVIESKALLEHVRSAGGYLRDQLIAIRSENCMIGRIQGRGLCVCVELTGECARRGAIEAQVKLLEAGIRVGVTSHATDVLKLTPPFMVSEREIDALVGALRKLTMPAS